MALCLVRNLSATACRALTQSHACRSLVQSRKFHYTKFLSASRFFTEKHEWVLIDGTKGTVGISNYAQDSLGDIVFVDLPEVGSEVQAGDVTGCVESVKAASDLYCPVNGTISEVNSELDSSPGLINQSPLDKGWIYKLDLGKVDTSDMMDEAAYEKYVESQ